MMKYYESIKCIDLIHIAVFFDDKYIKTSKTQNTK